MTDLRSAIAARRRGPLGEPLLALALLVALASPALGAEEELARGPVVITSGEAVIHATPDRAFVTLATESRAKSPKQAQQQNAEAMASVQQKLKGSGVAPEGIRTLSYDLSLEYDYVGGKQVPRGYVARNTIEVRLDAVDRVGEIIDVAVGAGATSVSGVRFDLKERDKVEREALKEAVADARARADAAASGSGNSVERVLKIEEQRTAIPPPRPIPYVMKSAEAAAVAPATEVAAGEIEVRAAVTLTAAIK